MSVDLSDPRITSAANDLRCTSPSIVWLVLGYKGSRVVLLETGDSGLDGLRGRLGMHDVLFGLVRLDDRVVSWSHIPYSVGGVKRARALVHARAISSALRAQHLTFAAASADEFERENLEARLQYSSPSLRTPPSQFSSPHLPPPPSQQAQHSPRSPVPYPTDQFAYRRPSLGSSQIASPQPTPISDRFESRRPSGSAPVPNGVSAGVADLSLRSNSPHLQQHRASPPVQTPSPATTTFSQHQHYQQHQTQHQQPNSGYIPVSPPHSASSSYPHSSQPQAGYPSILGAPIASSSSSSSPSPYAHPTIPPPSDSSLAPHSRPYPTRSGSLPSFQQLPTTPTTVRSPPETPDLNNEWGQRNGGGVGGLAGESTTSFASAASRDSVGGGGLFESAAAVMLAPSSPDSNSPESAQRKNAQQQQQRTSAMVPLTSSLKPHRHFSTLTSSGASLKPSVQSLPVDVVPDEDESEDDEGEGEREGERREKERREDEARLERERREREAEERAREEVERQRRRRVEEEEEERRRLEEAEEELRREEERLAAEEEEERRREEERVTLEEERIRLEEEERVRREEEEERTRQAEEEMGLLIERQRAEKKLREEEERRRVEEERVRAKEERRRVMLERREKGEVMLEGMVNVQGGDSMFWKRRHFHLSTSGLMLFKSEAETDHPLDTVPLTSIHKLTDGVEDALVPNSFKLTFSGDDDEELLFYTGEKEEKEQLIEGIKCAARMA
ncbi:hypothetical protein JCM8547_001239 [Rhodosporidiobolus lusitaniae]